MSDFSGKQHLVCILIAGCVLAAEGLAVDACSGIGSERSRSDADSSMGVLPEKASVPELVSANEATGVVVDVRSRSDRRKARLSSVLEMDLVRLRGLIAQSHKQFTIIGSGYNDQKLIRRIGGWPEAVGRIRVIEGGAAAWLVDQGRSNSARLKDALAVPPDRFPGIAVESGWQIVTFDQASHALARGRSRENSVRSSTEFGVLEEQLQGSGLADPRGILLIDREGQRSADESVRLTQLLQYPVFHVRGGSDAIENSMQRFADLDRDPAGINRGCQ